MSGVQLRMFNPLASQWHAMRLMMSDSVLVLLLLIGVLYYAHWTGFASLSFSYLLQRGSSPQEALLPVLAGACAEMAGACAGTMFGHLASTMDLFIVGNVSYVLAYMAMGPLFEVIGGAVAPYLAWILFGLGASQFFPSMQALISNHVPEEHQAKCQSAVFCASSLGGIVGPLFWNFWLFDASTEERYAEVRPILGSLAVSMVCVVLAFWMRREEALGNERRSAAATCLLAGGGSGPSGAAQY